MPSKETAIKHSTILAAYILIVWGFYRILFKFPDNIEDLIIKPIFWLLPVIYLVRKEKLGFSSVGLTFRNLFSSVYSALALGIFLTLVGLAMNFIKYKGINFLTDIGPIPFWTLLPLSLATGISEEITFRGYIFNRVMWAFGDEWKANIIVSSVWALVHLPIALFWWKLNIMGTIGILVLTFIFGVGSAFIFARTKNVTSSILLHMLWEWPIILFR
jgi:membrane protease YdiL (CAAX protease family)